MNDKTIGQFFAIAVPRVWMHVASTSGSEGEVVPVSTTMLLVSKYNVKLNPYWNEFYDVGSVYVFLTARGSILDRCFDKSNTHWIRLVK